MKIAICDDDKNIREQIAFLVKQQNQDCKIQSYASSEELLSDGVDYDMFFLDVEMGNISGIELAKEIRKRQDVSCSRCIIVFVTGFREYMEDAFDVNAFHYLVKPIREDKFAEVFHRAEKEISMVKEQADRYIMVKEGEQRRKLFLRNIRYIESMDRKAIFYMEHGITETYAKMYDLEEQLGKLFFRCHRGYLVNLEKVIAYSSNSIQVQGGDTIILAEKKYPDFVRAYLRYAKNGGTVNV